MRGVPVVLLILLLPAAEALPMTVYGHLGDGRTEFPLTAQEPDPAFTYFQSTGALPSDGCLPEVPGGPVPTRNHTFYGFATGVPVEYNATPEGSPRFHPERGIGFDARLDPSMPATVHWYLATDLREESVTPVPNVHVAATLRAGADIGISDAHYNEGEVLATGVSEPRLMAPGTPGHSVVEGRDVFHFEVPLEVRSPRLPADGFNLRIDVNMETPLCDADDGPMPGLVALHTSHGHRPRLELEVQNAVQVLGVQPSLHDTHATLHGEIQMLWTSEVPPLQVRLTGPAGELPVEVFIGSDRYCHCSVPPVAFSARADMTGAFSGLYVWNVTVGDGDAHATAQWTVGTPRDASGPLLPATALVVLAAARALRARRS